jgi:hypothetical protein
VSHWGLPLLEFRDPLLGIFQCCGKLLDLILDRVTLSQVRRGGRVRGSCGGDRRCGPAPFGIVRLRSADVLSAGLTGGVESATTPMASAASTASGTAASTATASGTAAAAWAD